MPNTPDYALLSTRNSLRWSLAKIYGAVIVIFVLLGVLLTVDLQRGYQKVLVDTEFRALHRSQIISQSFGTKVLIADFVLRDVLGRIQAKDIVYPDLDLNHAQRMTQLLKEKAATAPNLLMVIFNQDCVFTATETGEHQGVKSQQELCAARKMHTGSDPFISYVPGMKSASGKSVLALSRHLKSSMGNFQGGVLGVMELETTQRWFDELRLQPGDSVALLDENQVLLTRQPLLVEAIEKPVTSPSIASVLNSNSTEASVAMQWDVDGHERLFGFSKVEGFPFIIAYGFDKVKVLEDWRRRAVELGTGYCILLLLALLAAKHQGIILHQREELRASEAHFRVLAENMGDIVWQIDAQLRFSYVNAADQQMRGFAREEVIGSPIKDNLTPEGQQILEDILRKRRESEQSHKKGRVLKYELPMWHKNGGEVWIEMSSVPIYGNDGKIKGYQGVGRDITGRRLHEAKLLQSQKKLESQLCLVAEEKSVLLELANRDPLTGLYNRRHLDDALPRELVLAKCEEKQLAIIMLDIDHFKKVNDQHGHAAGDEVLKALAEVLKKGAREGDLICRYGGEEFMAIMPNMSATQALDRVETWRKQLENMMVIYGDCKISVTLSAGVAIFPDHGEDANLLIARADDMLYKSKREGRNQVNVFVLV